MKLTYRGVSYDYTPPTVEYSDTDTVGKYRGLDIRFRNPKKTPVLATNLDLMYRGVAYHEGAEAKAPVEAVNIPVVASVGAAVANDSNLTVAKSSPMSAEDRARTLMMGHHRSVKRRQQIMLTRLAAEVGLPTEDVAKYWNHVQGKVHPGFWATYDRSHVAFS